MLLFYGPQLSYGVYLCFLLFHICDVILFSINIGEIIGFKSLDEYQVWMPSVSNPYPQLRSDVVLLSVIGTALIAFLRIAGIG